jgi:ketosteroid isomerase-like protein
MGDSPVDIVRKAVEAVDGRDVTKLRDGGFSPEWLDQEAEFDLGRMALPDEATWQGRDAFLAGWQRWLEQWDAYRISGSNFEDCGGGRVLVDFHVEAQGRGSGAPMTVDNAQVWTVRDGRLLRIEIYPDRAEALDALSRSAQDAAGADQRPPAP